MVDFIRNCFPKFLPNSIRRWNFLDFQWNHTNPIPADKFNCASDCGVFPAKCSNRWTLSDRQNITHCRWLIRNGSKVPSPRTELPQWVMKTSASSNFPPGQSRSLPCKAARQPSRWAPDRLLLGAVLHWMSLIQSSWISARIRWCFCGTPGETFRMNKFETLFWFLELPRGPPCVASYSRGCEMPSHWPM